MTTQPIYLDYNATTPIDRRVAEAMVPYLYEHFGNPSSAHPYGVQAKRAVERARAQVAALLGCQPAEIVFTSGGSESNNSAIKGVAAAYRERGNHVITSAVEHPAVLEPCQWLESQGYRVTVLAVDEYGMVDPADVERAITPDTILVTIMHANNEVGTRDNLAFVEPHVDWSEDISEVQKLVLADAQTSGGLLIAVPQEQLEALLAALAERGVVGAAHIGEFTVPGPGRIAVRRGRD